MTAATSPVGWLSYRKGPRVEHRCEVRLSVAEGGHQCSQRPDHVQSKDSTVHQHRAFGKRW